MGHDEGRHEGKNPEEGQSHEEGESHEEIRHRKRNDGEGDGDARFEGKDFGGLKKDSLRKNKGGKFVSKKVSDRAKKNYAGSAFQKWTKACQAVRKELGLNGMVPMGGKTAQGRALYAKTKALYKA